MRTWALLLLILPLSGCLEDGNPFNGSDGPDPWVEPALADATIRPGVAIGDPGFCTANFLFLDADGATVYVGTAAHCVSDSADDSATSSTNTDGCDPVNLPYEPETVQVDVEGADHMAVLAYNSWWTMQARGETDAATCADNDFALLRLHPDDAARAHPSMLGFGGPTGIAQDEAAGDVLYTFGATTLRPGDDRLDARQGLLLIAGDWSHTALIATPGLPGDSGSAVIRDDGAAVGVLTTVAVAPVPASNGIADIGRLLSYAQDAGMDIELLTAPLA